ncbi:MAG: histidine--tRNA ligase, partial [Bacteroidales bacterium]|nr:histidine--tRNA ligase [Bacteroidales bacterium]
YPDTAKMKKQLQYADQLRIEYIAIIGEDELKNNNLSLKNMHTGEQTSCTTEELIGLLK